MIGIEKEGEEKRREIVREKERGEEKRREGKER